MLSNNYAKVVHFIKAHGLLSFSLLFLTLSFTIAKPYEVYPVNDEWAYGEPIRSWLESGRMIFPSTPFALCQVFLGCLLAKFLGFSYILLRHIILFFGLTACIFLYLTLRALGLSRNHSGLFSLVLSTNPMIMNLTSSFMSDVPAMALSFATCFFLCKSIMQNTLKYWAATTICLTLAVTTRQTCLALVFGLISLAILQLLRKNKVWAASTTVIVISLFGYLAAAGFHSANCADKQPGLEYQLVLLHKGLTAFTSWADLARNAMTSLGYTAFFLFPAILPLFASIVLSDKHKRITILSLYLLVCLPFLDVSIRQKQLMPWSPNLYSPPLMGAYALIGQFPQLDWLQVFPIVATGIAVLSAPMAFILLWLSIRATAGRILRSTCDGQFEIFLLIVTLASYSFLILQLSIFNFDRYIISIWPPVLILLGLIWKERAKPKDHLVAILLAVVFGITGLIELVDTHQFHRNKEKCIRFLLKRGVNAEEIDGGPEFNLIVNASLLSTYTLNKQHPELSGFDLSVRGSETTQNMRWWTISSEKYIISTKPLPGYRVIFASRYWSPIFFSHITTLCLERIK